MWDPIAEKVMLVSEFVLNGDIDAVKDAATEDESFAVWAVQSGFLTSNYLPAESFWLIVHVFSCLSDTS